MAAEKDLVLLDLWLSPFAVRVKIALAEKEVEFESKEEDLSNKSPLLLEMNPVHKKIPVLIHMGRPICESLIIVEYIDQVWNSKSPLLPSDPYERAKSRFLADLANTKVYPSAQKLWAETEEAQESAKKELIDLLKLYEAELGEKDYFGGESLGFVDIALLPYSSWFFAWEMRANFSIEKECPKLMAWVQRCMKRPSVAHHMPDRDRLYNYVMDIIRTLER